MGAKCTDPLTTCSSARQRTECHLIVNAPPAEVHRRVDYWGAIKMREIRKTPPTIHTTPAHMRNASMGYNQRWR